MQRFLVCWFRSFIGNFISFDSYVPRNPIIFDFVAVFRSKVFDLWFDFDLFDYEGIVWLVENGTYGGFTAAANMAFFLLLEAKSSISNKVAPSALNTEKYDGKMYNKK